MTQENKQAITNYSPTWFLKALGNGGLAVSFFMYLMFFIDHKTPIPIFTDVYRELTNQNAKSTFVAIILVIILYFAGQYFIQLFKQIALFKKFKQSQGYKDMIGTNEEIKLMSLPLTYAMGINVLFILGAVYVPHLWDIVEYLFPFAILAFFMVGLYASKLFFNYFNDTLAKGNFDFVNNNSLGQMIAPFAFIMVSVGLAASVAMSHTTWTNVIALVASLFFLTLTIFLINIKLVLGFKSIFKYGVDKKAAPTLWIVIPIMTLTGITLVRIISGIYHHIIGANPPAIVFLIILSVLVALQLIFALIGYGVMKRHQYFETFVEGQAFEVGSFALICPGVAFVVLGMFFVNFGFVKTGFIDKYSLSHYLMVLPFVYVQIKTIITLNKLNRKSKTQLFI